MNHCVLIQGQDTYLDKLTSYHNKNYIVFSTWNGNKTYFKYTVASESLENPGYGNSALQFHGWYKGVQLCKELGFDYILKIRADLDIKDIYKIFEFISPLKMSFLAYHNWDNGYLVDYIIGGPTNIMLTLSHNLSSFYDHNIATEKQIMEELETQGIDKVQYLLPIFKAENISCYSHKWERDLTKSMSEDSLFIFPDKIF